MGRSFYHRLKYSPVVVYAYFRLLALRAGLSDRRTRRATGERLPVPPPRLRHRVSGTLDRSTFLSVGRRCATDIEIVLGAMGRDVFSFHDVLDFGCGCGRVTRYFADRPATCRLLGTDIDRDAIAWNRRHLAGLATWDVNRAWPPLAYADGRFDLIYGISVFTHLDEAMQFAWLRELRRVAAPGGVLLLTVHGADARTGPEWREEERRTLARTGICVRVVQSGRFRLDPLPDFYQATFHTRDYIDREWSRVFRIARYVEAGMNGSQDVVVLVNDAPAPR